MKKELTLLLSLLNDVETHGRVSLNNLLASIQLVEGMLQRLPEERKLEECNNGIN